eukprot:9079389-Ditylum_brightwellii.AAC.1
MDTTQAETEWDDETDIEEKEGGEEESPTPQEEGKRIDKHEFYRLGVEIGQDRILQCRNATVERNS